LKMSFMNRTPISLPAAGGRFNERLLRDRGRAREWVARRCRLALANALEALSLGHWGPPEPLEHSKVEISLTSWKPRLPELPLVLLTLIQQTVRPRAINLWLSPADIEFLDPQVPELFAPYGLRIRMCDDLRCHKKWLPMVESGHREPFVICDDDIIYPREWFARLIAESDGDYYAGCKCHRIVREPDGTLAPYATWEKQITYDGQASHSIFVTGCGGAVIKPMRLREESFSRDEILAKCPNADDVWLKAAHQASGIPCFKTRYSFPCLELPGSSAVGLAKTNVSAHGNDVQLANVADMLPTSPSPRSG
jgi:hypothetical protein